MERYEFPGSSWLESQPLPAALAEIAQRAAASTLPGRVGEGGGRLEPNARRQGREAITKMVSRALAGLPHSSQTPEGPFVFFHRLVFFPPLIFCFKGNLSQDILVYFRDSVVEDCRKRIDLFTCWFPSFDPHLVKR